MFSFNNNQKKKFFSKIPIFFLLDFSSRFFFIRFCFAFRMKDSFLFFRDLLFCLLVCYCCLFVLFCFVINFFWYSKQTNIKHWMNEWMNDHCRVKKKSLKISFKTFLYFHYYYYHRHHHRHILFLIKIISFVSFHFVLFVWYQIDDQ